MSMHAQAESALVVKGKPRREDETRMARRLLGEHMSKEHHSTLVVTVLEVRGLRPRKGACVSEAHTPPFAYSLYRTLACHALCGWFGYTCGVLLCICTRLRWS